MGLQLAFLVPSEFLARQPADALQERALDLAEVDRRIQRRADVVQDVDAQQLCLAAERIDRDFRTATPYEK